MCYHLASLVRLMIYIQINMLLNETIYFYFSLIKMLCVLISIVYIFIHGIKNKKYAQHEPSYFVNTLCVSAFCIACINYTLPLCPLKVKKYAVAIIVWYILVSYTSIKYKNNIDLCITVQWSCSWKAWRKVDIYPPWCDVNEVSLLK